MCWLLERQQMLSQQYVGNLSTRALRRTRETNPRPRDKFHDKLATFIEEAGLDHPHDKK
jgi:hypothetical protein